MAYADQKMSSSKIVAIVVVVLIHAVLGYAFVTGLAFQYVKKVTKDLNAFDVEEPPPPPPDEPPPPPPPDQPMQPPPVVSPPPIVQLPTPPPQIVTVQTPPPVAPIVPVAAPPPTAPPVRPVSQAARLNAGDLQRLLGDPANYPDAARDAGAQGSVVAQLQIGPNGRVTSCNVTKSAGNAALDRQTCALTSRMRATPAKDDAGNPISAPYTLRFRWALPEE